MKISMKRQTVLEKGQTDYLGQKNPNFVGVVLFPL